MVVDEYKYLDLRDTFREEFVRCLNRLARDGWRPVWKTLEERPLFESDPYGTINVSCYLFRVTHPTRENKVEQGIVLAEEGVNQYPTMGPLIGISYEEDLQDEVKVGVLVDEN